MIVLENDGGIGVVGHEVDIGPEVVFGRLLGVPMEFVLELVAPRYLNSEMEGRALTLLPPMVTLLLRAL